MSKKAIGPSIPLEDLELEEFVPVRTEDIKTREKMDKKATTSAKVEVENDEHSMDISEEEENNEDETNVVSESKSDIWISRTDEIIKGIPTAENKPDNLDSKTDGSICDEKSSSEKSIYIIKTDGTIKGHISRNEMNTTPTEEKGTKNRGNNNKSNSNNGDKGKKVAKEIGLFALKTAAISGAVIGGTALIVPALGFGAAGVAAGSLAAGFQSAFLGGTIASGSAFAVLQSIGAAGLSAAAQAGIIAGSAAASGAHSAFKNREKETEKEEAANEIEENKKKF